MEGEHVGSLWSARIESYPHCGKLLKDVSDVKDDPESASRDTWKGLSGIVESIPAIDPAKFEKSQKAKDLIVLNVGNKVLRKIKHCETDAIMWSTLDKLYTDTSLPNRIYLQLRFYTF